jgi:hypothetical protein
VKDLFLMWRLKFFCSLLGEALLHIRMVCMSIDSVKLELLSTDQVEYLCEDALRFSIESDYTRGESLILF